jgi:hypothetical protein
VATPCSDAPTTYSGSDGLTCLQWITNWQDTIWADGPMLPYPKGEVELD